VHRARQCLVQQGHVDAPAPLTGRHGPVARRAPHLDRPDLLHLWVRCAAAAALPPSHFQGLADDNQTGRVISCTPPRGPPSPRSSRSA
jgi:hypothetical protein